MTDGTPPNNTPGPDEKKYWLDRPENVDKIYWSVIIVCAALFLGDAFYHKHPYFSMEKVFGFYGIFGFVACVGLVLAAKELRRFLMRDEDYYDKADDDTKDTR